MEQSGRFHTIKDMAKSLVSGSMRLGRTWFSVCSPGLAPV